MLARCARTTLDSATNSVLPSDTLAGILMRRGSTRGSLTIWIGFSRPKASLPPRRTMKFSDLLATCGNGCAGSSPTGISSGRTSRSKYSLTHLRWAGLRSPCDTMWMPCVAKVGISSSLYSAYWRATSAWAASDKRSKDSTV
ncbi:hypothetical protein D3C72_1986790 [compost metagenome]